MKEIENLGKIQGSEKSDKFNFGQFAVNVIVGYPSITIKQTCNLILNFNTEDMIGMLICEVHQ